MVQKLIYYILDPQLINQNVFFFQLEVDGNFHKRILCPNVKFGPKSTFILHSMCRVKYRTCFPLPFLLNCSPIPQKMSNSPQCMFKNQFQKWGASSPTNKHHVRHIWIPPIPPQGTKASRKIFMFENCTLISTKGIEIKDLASVKQPRTDLSSCPSTRPCFLSWLKSWFPPPPQQKFKVTKKHNDLSLYPLPFPHLLPKLSINKHYSGSHHQAPPS